MATYEGNLIDRVREKTLKLIFRHQDLQDANAELQKQVLQLQEDLSVANAKIAELQAQYASLKVVKSLSISDREAKDLHKRMSKLEREVDNCISLLNE